MRQLTGLDASFLHMETNTTFGHVSGLGIYRRPDAEFSPYDVVHARFAALVGQVEPLRRRLVTVPFGLDHPYWINDPDFDLDFHVRHLGLAPPGSQEQLSEQVARIFGRALDRTRPLWEVYVIEGLDDGRWALMTKFHHSTLDGAAGVIMLQMLTETDPTITTNPTPVEWEPEQEPSPVELLQRTTRSLIANPAKSVRLQLRLAQKLAESVGIPAISQTTKQVRKVVRRATQSPDTARPDNERQVRLPITPAPSTPWNRTITAHRRFAMRSTSLENLKTLKNATGGTLNDVVMTICTGALREYLQKHDCLPAQPLRAMVPVSIRTGDETDPWTNRVSAIVADLPTNSGDPLERLRLCHDAMEIAKRQFDLIPADALMEGSQVTSPVIATAAVRLASRLRLAERFNTPVNVVISNVPGPRHPLYFCGAQMENYVPLSIVTDGMGLNITVHSYLDRLEFGLIACRELVPDLDDLVQMHINEMDRLFSALGLPWTVPQPVG